jgi:pyruvate/2-oxoglutarate/acetoin dehydrogenase E1 component
MALHQAMAADERVYLLGEDLLDPYGGAFKVSRGLSSAFPQRVLTTPISEAAITGFAAGMALRGLRPVVEVMFGDFITLTADQLINHIAKFRWMYNEQVRVPVVLRTPMGGRRGYGPTHSQTLEKLFLGIPGLQVVAPCALYLGDEESDGAGGLLKRLILNSSDPSLFIENKLLYLASMQSPHSLHDFHIENHPIHLPDLTFPTYRLTIAGAPPPQLTLAAYGYMVELAREAALKLAYAHEVFVELIVPTLLAPFQISTLINSVQQTGRLLTIEEGTLSGGWGGEVLARCAEQLGKGLQVARRVAAQETPIPAAGPLESQALPGIDAIIAVALSLIGKN